MQICWACAILLVSAKGALSRVIRAKFVNLLISMLLVAYGLVSILRTLALIQFYGAPLQVYTYFPKADNHSKENIVVCVGDEWDKYPSSFFMPSRRHRLHYLEQNFSGQHFFGTDNVAINVPITNSEKLHSKMIY